MFDFLQKCEKIRGRRISSTWREREREGDLWLKNVKEINKPLRKTTVCVSFTCGGNGDEGVKETREVKREVMTAKESQKERWRFI